MNATTNMPLCLTDLEEAINYWRIRRPSTGEECALSPEVNALAGLYARMIMAHAPAMAPDELDTHQRQLLEAWCLARAGQTG